MQKKNRKLDELFDECVEKAKNQIVIEKTIKPNPIILVLSGDPRKQIKIDLFATKTGDSFEAHDRNKEFLSATVKKYIESKQALGYIMVTDAWYLMIDPEHDNRKNHPISLADDPAAKESLFIIMRTVGYSKLQQIFYERRGNQIYFKQVRKQYGSEGWGGRFFDMLPSFN